MVKANLFRLVLNLSISVCILYRVAQQHGPQIFVMKFSQNSLLIILINNDIFLLLYNSRGIASLLLFTYVTISSFIVPSI